MGNYMSTLPVIKHAGYIQKKKTCNNLSLYAGWETTRRSPAPARTCPPAGSSVLSTTVLHRGDSAAAPAPFARPGWLTCLCAGPVVDSTAMFETCSK